MMLTKVRNTIDKYNLIVGGDSVLVGLSGGPDSVALLHLLVALRRKMKLKLAAVYINHGIRPRAAKKETAFCRDFCDGSNVALSVIEADIPALARKSRKGLEEAGRDFRYETYEHLAREHTCDRVALGHHVDDRVETVLFRIFRGTGRTGLEGIPVRRGRIVRPLYDCTKEEIYSYLDKNHLRYCIDTSNRRADPSGFKRNYIRNRLLVNIRKNLNPAVNRAILNLSETAATEERFLEKLVTGMFRKVIRITPGGKIELDLIKFRGYDVSLRCRLLRRCVAELSGLMPNRCGVERLDKLATDGGKAVSVPNRIHAVRMGDRLTLFRKQSHCFSEELIPGRVCRLKSLRLAFKCRAGSYSGKSLNNERRSRSVLLDKCKLVLPLLVRNIQPGDRFRPLGMKGSKKVGNYLTDRKVPGIYRDEIPVVCDREGIVWLVGFEIADRVKIDRSTKEVLAIEFYKQRVARAKAV
ncbi:MAG: tRNA lysidine(34) synthetase TilS [candidate division Zixibacteria bacterium]|nr:tRNA lysidine(34) synthetase TilS [candidate division Zixibacteria bacterium]